MFWLLKKLLLSVFIIILVHQLVNFIKDKYTNPKIIDLVDNPEKRYKNILNTLQENNTNVASPVEHDTHHAQYMQPPIKNNENRSDTTSIDNLLPITKNENKNENNNNEFAVMNNELQNYFNDLSKINNKENKVMP